jgi:hypothetical protein
MYVYSQTRRKAVRNATRAALGPRQRRCDGGVKLAAAVSPAIEAMEMRRLLSFSWTIDSSRTLQITSDDNPNSIDLRTNLSDPATLDLGYHNNADGSPWVNELIPLADFDRINVQMGANSPFNYCAWVDDLPISSTSLARKPATIDLAAGGNGNNIMFFITNGAASVSGDPTVGAHFTRVGTPQPATVTYKNAASTQLSGGDGADHFDGSAFTGHSLVLGGGGGDDTLIGGRGDGVHNGGTAYFGGDGDDVFVTTAGGHNTARGGPGNDTYIGGPGDGSMLGEEGDDTYYSAGGDETFFGGSGNDTYFGAGTDGHDVIVAGPWIDTPNSTYLVLPTTPDFQNRLFDVENVRFDAGAGVDDGIIPATPGVPYGNLLIAGPLAPGVDLQITHLEPTVDAGPDAGLVSTHTLAATGSFRDIGDHGNAWTASVDYGDGSGPQSLAFSASTISTANGPAHTFNLNHTYATAGTYTVTVTVTDSEGDQGSDALSVNVPNLNHAPVLNGANDLPTITEDEVNNGGTTPLDLLLGHRTDADFYQGSGIAIVGYTAGNGRWQYNDPLDGYRWKDLGAVSDTSALLVGFDNSIRFLPDSKNGTAATLIIRAWDQTNDYYNVDLTRVDVSVNGGTTPYSSAVATAHITVTDANDPPVLIGVNDFAPITEDDVNNNGAQVSDLLSAHANDVDHDAVAPGIAVYGLSADDGETWQYSLDNGATWTSFGAMSLQAATVLGPDARVRLCPNGRYGVNGDPGFPRYVTFGAWDRTDGLASGTTGVNVITIPNDAVSGAIIKPYGGLERAGIVVADVNDAPVLTGAHDYPSITEDDVDNVGLFVYQLFDGNITDVDLQAPYAGNAHNTRAIAIVGSSAGNGTWQYGDDTGWVDIAPVSDTSALQLYPDDRVRFRPDGKNGTTASLTFRAWDGYNDLVNTKQDASINGGATPYSSTVATAHITVTDANDPPVLIGVNDFAPITEDDVNNNGSRVSDLLAGHVTDVDHDAVAPGIAVYGLSADDGEAWQYSIDNGVNWTSFGAVSLQAATVLGPDARVRLRPNGRYGVNGDPGFPHSITLGAWDRSDGLASGATGVNVAAIPQDPVTGAVIKPYGGFETARIVVADVNDAPVLTGAHDLPSITEDDVNNSGVFVYQLFDGYITDVDLQAPYAGNSHNTRAIAIVGLSAGDGTWQYGSANGWVDIAPVSDTSALQLYPDTRVRFRPDGNNGTTASLTFRAWDGYNDLVNTKQNASVNGGATPYSSAVATAHITVTDLNDAPTAANDSYAAQEDTPLIVAAPGVLANDHDNDGDSLHAVLVSGTAHGTLVLNDDGGFTYTPEEDFYGGDSFRYRANDGQAISLIWTVSITVSQATAGAALVPDPCGDGTALLVDGTPGNDSVLVNPAGSGSGYEISLNGQSLGVFSGVERIIIRTHEGDDTIQVAGTVDIPTWQFGGSGNDHLNAGNADSVVIGGSGADELHGGSGADLIIGGLGGDHLVGNPGDDILIAGRSDFDRNFTALCRIMDEWTRNDASFVDRVEHLKGTQPGGYNAPFFLNADTVHDDGVIDQVDILAGSAGNDWYIYDRASGDRANGVSVLESGEAITNI